VKSAMKHLGHLKKTKLYIDVVNKDWPDAFDDQSKNVVNCYVESKDASFYKEEHFNERRKALLDFEKEREMAYSGEACLCLEHQYCVL
jgi:hypothetical protein